LDFGAGIGSSGILFDQCGFNVTLADISDTMLNYAKWRLSEHNIFPKFINLKSESIPSKTFECITAIEVLEHIQDPMSAMSKIKNALKPGGLAFITTPFHVDSGWPQHIVHEMAIADDFEKLGLKLISKSDKGLYRIYKNV